MVSTGATLPESLGGEYPETTQLTISYQTRDGTRVATGMIAAVLSPLDWLAETGKTPERGKKAKAA